jgi:L-glyceraldehyde 3-phosphate reductase
VTIYRANDERYQRLEYRRAGRSGLGLPPLSLGLWQKFGADYPFDLSSVTLSRFAGAQPADLQ